MTPDAGTPVRPAEDPFCENRPRIGFCEDFDVDALPGSFARVEQEGSATIALDTADPSSPPHALRVSSDGEGVARVVQTFAEGHKFRIFLFVNVGALDHASEGEAELLAIDVQTAEGPYRAALATDSRGAWFATIQTGDASPSRLEIDGALPTDVWMTARFDLEFLEGGNATLKIRFGADEVLYRDDLTPPSPTGVPTASIGLASTGDAEWTLRYDNVTFELD